jgi:hypothetical protein
MPALDRLNRSRIRAGKTPLLDHIEVLSPVLLDSSAGGHNGAALARRAPRLHHVRGHLVRRGSQLSWRVPHLRGNARSGVIRARTVTWTIDRLPSRSSREGIEGAHDSRIGGGANAGQGAVGTALTAPAS